MQSGSCGNETPKRHDEGEDMISNLPEPVIGHILSFLSTKQAIATSVLSKRWKYIWTLVTKLSFYDRECSYHPCNSSNKFTNLFSDFVSSALIHLNSPIIQEFDLVIHEISDPYYISQWLYTVLQRRVKKINVYSLKPCIISSSPLFECPTLEKLVLTMTRCCCSNIKVPSFVSLPSLTVLKLTGITFTSYASANKLKELTLHFPLLREYKTHDCTWSGVKSITLEAPLLETVETLYGDCDSTPEIVKFCASYITNLSFRGDVSSSQTILLDDDQHITSTSILLFNQNNYSLEEVWIFLHRLLSLSINAKYLKLYYSAHQQRLARVEHYLDGIPAFRMMGHVHLGPVTGDVLLDFLLKSPCLKTLVLQMADDDAESDNYAIVPDCFLSTLKVVKFAKYFDREHELRFAKFVLENAKVLEKVSFSFHKQRPWTEVDEAKEKLRLIMISCSTVTVEFSAWN